MGGEVVPDMSAILDTHYNKQTGRLQTYHLQVPDCCHRDFTEMPPLIDTCDTQRVEEILEQWIEHSEPFILVGPEGKHVDHVLCHDLCLHTQDEPRCNIDQSALCVVIFITFLCCW